MKVYVAGAISSDPNYKEKFAKYEKLLTESGNIVLNPAMLPAGMKYSDYIRICLSMIDVADTIYLIPGWLKSKGALYEFNYAVLCCKEIIYGEELL